jgi:hypothetical protein
MDFKLTSPKSLLESVKKDFAKSVEEKAMTASAAAQGGTAQSGGGGLPGGMTRGKARRIFDIARKQLGEEVKAAKEAIGAMDVSKQRKAVLDRQLSNQAIKTQSELKSLLGFNK